MTRPNLNAVAMISRELDQCICSTGFHVLRAAGIEPAWLFYIVQSATFIEAMVKLVQGALYPAVRPKDIRGFRIPVAPVREQRRIVAEIEKQFTQLDAGVAALKRVRANLKRYRASILKAACEGRLVPTEAELARAEGRDYEPARALTERLLAERRLDRRGSPVRRTRNYPTAPSGIPAQLPGGWAWVTLEQVTTLITSGSRGWAEHYSESGPLFVRAQDIKTDNLRLDSVARVSPPAGAEGTRTRVGPRDLLVTITGANVTKSALVPAHIPESYVSQHVGLIRPTSVVLSPYLYLWIVSPANGRRTLESCAYGAGKPGLNLDNLRELEVALPPVEEQSRIVAEVERLLSIVDEVEREVAANLARAQSLRQAILQAAFAGGLVPQDPKDEPAAEMLKRIREEIGSTKPAASPRSGKGRQGLSRRTVEGATSR